MSAPQPRPAEPAGALVVPPLPAVTPVAAPAVRLAGIDWMRGLVMVLMTIDHASAAFNGGRLRTDGVLFWKVGSALPAEQFLTRWLTHLCAPTFVFLAGVSLALSVERRLAAGEAPRSIDRFQLVRALIIGVADPLWMSIAFRGPGNILFQVMFAIGGSMACMVFLRRLGTRTLVVLGLALIAGDEVLVDGAFWLNQVAPLSAVVTAPLSTGGVFANGRLTIAYPLLGWLPMMCLGWAFGRYMLAHRSGTARLSPARLLAFSGVGALAIFAIVRGLNGYGNLQLYREGDSLVQWLHVSKYPPSLTYAGLELGLMALLLAGFLRLGERAQPPQLLAPLRLLGQTALFYYLLHVHLAKGAALVLGLNQKLGLASAYVGAAGVLLALIPACAWYRRYKAAHPLGWARYI